MRNRTMEDISEILDRYIMPAKQLFQLSSESLVQPVSRLVDDDISESDLIEALDMIGYKPYISNDIVWDQEYSVPAHFKIKFIRDTQTIGLYSPYDKSLCKSRLLKCIILNACYNEEKCIRDFCRYMNRQQDMCSMDISDDQVTDYLKWMVMHTPSPKSTYAAVVLYFLNRAESYILSPDQLQYIRENPNLLMKTHI